MFVTIALAAALAVADATTPPCDLECERRAAAALLDAGQTLPAVARLRAARERFPEDRALALLLARAYCLDDNLFWAERVLRERLAHHPEDAEMRAWLASLLLRQGDTDLARGTLDPALKPAGGAERARWDLLDALRLDAEGDAGGAAAALGSVPRAAPLFAEDVLPWRHLQRRENPTWIEPMRGALELSAGRTSNAMAGSPTDPGVRGGASAFAGLDLDVRVVPPGKSRLRPLLDLELSGHGLGEAVYEDLSTLEGAIRLGAARADRGRQLLVAYRGERLLVNQDESLYATAHRVEVEHDSASGTVAFGGFGHRSYREDRRTRWEADAGAGVPLPLPGAPSAVVGATVRLADAASPAYDQIGLSLAATSRWPLGKGFAVRLAAAATWDDYPHSGGAEGLAIFGSDENRRDLLGRMRVTLQVPPWHGVTPGVEWQYSKRRSTLDDKPGADYSFRESRLVLMATWRFSPDPWAPRTVTPPGHVPMPWGVGGGDGEQGESIIDMLRQDEELRRGSSCVVR